MGSATVKSGGGGQDWNVTKLLCINKIKCHKMLI